MKAGADASGHRSVLRTGVRESGFLHLNARYHGGSLWVCSGTCGVISLGKPAPAVPSYTITAAADPAYDADYVVGRLTASPPAVPAHGP